MHFYTYYYIYYLKIKFVVPYTLYIYKFVLYIYM